jgi:hypothetical protein
VVDAVAEQVQVLIGAIDRGDLGCGQQRNAMRAAASASPIPSTVSWSLSANSSTPARAACSMTPATGSSPSEYSE